MDQRLFELETMIVDAWPAAETATLEGWLLRASGGPTHRGNSTATLGATGSASLDDRIDGAERWYRERRRPVMFQVGPCASPSGLDAALAARGYIIEGAACFAAAPTSTVLERTSVDAPLSGGASVLAESSPGRGWLELNASASRFADSLDAFLGFITRLGSRCLFVSVHTPQGEVAATGLGIRSGARLGVYAMLTAPSFRRRGAARALLHALAESALEAGQPELYLLFEPANVAARSLYVASGFSEVYGYHYRSKPSAER
jgi:ribosomal protein S18 acetylase RimI-like enzyme